jgi:hypothetical protein
LRPGSQGRRPVRAANRAREGIGLTRGLAIPGRCESARAVQRALILLAPLDYQSRKDSRFTKTRRFGAMRRNQSSIVTEGCHLLRCYRRGRKAGVASAMRADDRRSGRRRVLLQAPWCLRYVGCFERWWSLTARVDPVACPLGRVLQRLLFTLEVIE